LEEVERTMLSLLIPDEVRSPPIALVQWQIVSKWLPSTSKACSQKQLEEVERTMLSLLIPDEVRSPPIALVQWQIVSK